MDNQWRVNGSNGKHYTSNGIRTIKITVLRVKGYIYRKRCRHITELSESLGDNFC